MFGITDIREFNRDICIPLLMQSGFNEIKFTSTFFGLINVIIAKRKSPTL